MMARIKQIIFIVMILVQFPILCNSQFISLGLKGGISLSSVDEYSSGKLTTAPMLSGMLMNFNGGITLDLKLHDRWYFHSEILFEDKGCRVLNKDYKADSIPGTQLIRNHFFYLHFPQTARYLIPLDSKENNFIYFELGPYFACYLISKDVVVTTINDSETRRVDYFDRTSGEWAEVNNIQRFDWGLTCGIGYILKQRIVRMDFNIKFDHMLYPGVKSLFDNSKYYSYVLASTIGFSIPVIRRTYK